MIAAQAVSFHDGVKPGTLQAAVAARPAADTRAGAGTRGEVTLNPEGGGGQAVAIGLPGYPYADHGQAIDGLDPDEGRLLAGVDSCLRDDRGGALRTGHWSSSDTGVDLRDS